MPPMSPNRRATRLESQAATCQDCDWNRAVKTSHASKSAVVNAARLHNETTGHTVTLRSTSVGEYRGPQIRHRINGVRFTQPIDYTPTNPDPNGNRFRKGGK